MKHEIIYTEHYALIVSDEEINDVRPYKGKYHIEKGYIINQFPTYLTDLSECKLIIGHKPLKNAPVLEGVPLLPEFSEKEDVEKKSRDFIKEIGGSQEQRLAFIDGYLQAKETYKYTEDYLIAFSNFVTTNLIHHSDSNGFYIGVRKVLELFKQTQQPKRPKYFDCEIEYIHDVTVPYPKTLGTKPKTITNPKGQTELIGTYFYE
jgi:hypothetical protein